jgi:hypothetical protein
MSNYALHHPVRPLRGRPDGDRERWAIHGSPVPPSRGREAIVTLQVQRITTALALLLIQAAAGPSLADPPIGDTCESPIAVPLGYEWAFSGDLTPYANNYDPALPGPSCTDSAEPGKDAVFSITVTCGQFLSVYLEPVGFDGALYIVTDCADITGTCVAGSDNAGPGGAESTGMDVTFGHTFYVIVDAHDPDARGAFDISFNIGLWDIPPGACCFPDGHCEIIHVDFCAEAGGVTEGPCVPCDPNPCSPTPTPEGSWGAIKARYR